MGTDLNTRPVQPAVSPYFMNNPPSDCITITMQKPNIFHRCYKINFTKAVLVMRATQLYPRDNDARNATATSKPVTRVRLVISAAPNPGSTVFDTPDVQMSNILLSPLAHSQSRTVRRSDAQTNITRVSSIDRSC